MTVSASKKATNNPDEIIAERGRSVMVMRRDPDSGKPVPGYLTWGLIPHGSAVRPDILPTNARAETVADLPMFREAWRKRRCLVPIDAFQQKDGKGKRHTVRRADGEPMAIAAIWENWKNPETGQWERTFATITIEANATLGEIHSRMPLIIEKSDFARWLGVDDEPRDLLKPSADDVLVVGSRNGKPSHRS